MARLSGEIATPAIQSSPRSRSWKDKLQRRVSSLKRPKGTEGLTKNASITQSSDILSELGNAWNNTNQGPRLQSESLDSLTSASLFSRNSYPSIYSIGTDATSTSGTFAGCGITFAIDSQSIKPYKRMKNNLIVYLAHDDIELPLDAIEQWETADRDRLQTDLGEAVMEIYRKGVDRESKRPRNTLYLPPESHEHDISFELRMSGRATRDAQQVAIGPSIWIVCGSTWACKEIRTAMDEITWPTLPVEVHEGRVAVPSVAEGQIDLGKLDITDGYHLGDGIMLYVHVEDPSSYDTSCGLLCCATIKDGNTYSHHFSRIGGLIAATSTLTCSHFGVSTAHGILDYPWWHQKLRERIATATSDCQNMESAENHDIADDDDMDNDSPYDYQQSPLSGQRDMHNAYKHTSFPFDEDLGAGYRDPQLVSRWKNVSRQGIFSFLGASIATDNSLRHLVPLHDGTGTQTDHSMVQFDWCQDTGLKSQINKYALGALPKRPINIETHVSNKELIEGAVGIICRTDSALDARLLPGSTCLAMGGRLFTLRKLKATAPLARGVSGSWVARGTELYGMVIAVTSQEPYVYMMRAEDLICNLGSNNPSIETVEVFNPHRSKVHHGAEEIRLKTWRSQRSQRQCVKAINPPDRSFDEPQPIISTKRGLSMSLRNFGGSSGFLDTVGSDPSHGKTSQPRRKRSVRGLLSDMFSNRVEEIIPFAKSEAIDTQTAADTRRSSATSIHNYHNRQVRIHTLLGKKARMHSPLESIPETPFFGLGTDSALEPEYIYLQSTAYAPIVGFCHGPIRLHKPGHITRQNPLEKPGLGCAEYEMALRETADHWLSGNYESQQEREQETDDIEDLLDWWESWGIEDAGGPTAENVDEPPSPSSTSCGSLPGVSYSDTGSEDSVSSYQVWTSHQELDTQRLPQEWASEYEQDIKQIPAKKLSEHSIGGLNPGVIGGLTRSKSLASDKDALCEYHYVHGITV